MWAGKELRFRRIMLVASMVGISLAAFCVVHILSTPSRLAAVRTRPYIPKPFLLPDSAVLDLQTALLFQVTNGYFGYLYFTAASAECAEYVIVLLRKNGTNIQRIAKNRGRVHFPTRSNKRADTQKVKCAHVSMHWLPPTTLFFLEEIRSVMLVPLSDVHLVEQSMPDETQWTRVSVPPL